MFKPILEAGRTELKQAIEKLIIESRPNLDFYFMLSISTLIVTLGLLENSAITIIGGMVVAPLLSPILGIGLAITTASKKGLLWLIPNFLKAIGLSMLFAFVLAFFFGKVPGSLTSFQPNLNFFMIAFAAGAGGAYAWIRPNLSAAIPGIAITVSLLPPLAATSIGISQLSHNIIAGSFALFLINLLGIILASVIVFLLFGFGALQAEEDKAVKEKGEAPEVKK